MGLFGRKDKEHPPGGESIRDLVAMAKQMQAAAVHQMEAVQQASASAGGAPVGSTAWMRELAGILQGPQPGYVKRCTCTVCGAPKKLPSVTAYVYCDYCGSLVDFDLHRACEMSTLPGPEYAALVNGAQVQLRAAQAAGDRDGYRARQRQIFSAYVTACPNAVSHRAKGDLAYREQYVAYLAEAGVARAFDPDAMRMDQEMTHCVTGLQWSGSFGAMKVSTESFRPIVDVLARQLEVYRILYRSAGVTALDPDKAEYLGDKIAWSEFCQGWLQYLAPDAAEELLRSHGLVNEFVPVSPETGEARSCAGCGGHIHALPGAKVVVCDGCGRSLDVGAAALTCPGCGGSITLPVGASDAACPFCRTNVERVGVL